MRAPAMLPSARAGARTGPRAPAVDRSAPLNCAADLGLAALDPDDLRSLLQELVEPDVRLDLGAGELAPGIQHGQAVAIARQDFQERALLRGHAGFAIKELDVPGRLDGSEVQHAGLLQALSSQHHVAVVGADREVGQLDAGERGQRDVAEQRAERRDLRL